MAWTPEMVYGTIVAVGTGFVAVAGTLNKLKVIKIPFRRNNNNQSNQFSGMSVSDIEKRCRGLHVPIESRLLDIDKTNSQQEESLRQVEMRLNKGDDKFTTIIEKLSDLNADIKTEAAKSESREKVMEMTINLANQTMREFLQKTG